MNTERIIDALELIGDSYKQEAMELMNYKQKGKKSPKKLAKIFLVAAIIASLFTVTAYASAKMINSPEGAKKVAAQELTKLKEMGLLSEKLRFEGEADFVMELEERQGDEYWYERIFPHRYCVRWNPDEGYLINLEVDTASGKIIDMAIEAYAGEDAEPTEEFIMEVPIDDKGNTRPMTMYYYDNFDDIFDADMSIDRFCTLLAEYWGFEGYTISETVEDVFYNQQWEAPAGDTPLSELAKMENFYLTVYFEGDQKGAPMYVQVQRFPGQVSLFAGTHHLVG